MRAALLALLLLAGCDAEVSRTPNPLASEVVSSSQSCAKGPGYCYACALGIDGKFNCGFGFKYSCPGTRPTTIRRTPVLVRYESGKTATKHSEELLSVDGACT